MPVLTDEVLLSIDGFVFVDPATGLRQRAEIFLTARQWLTSEIFYGDQPEPEDVVEQQPAWSMAFVLGLDHIKEARQDWFADVTALLSFVQSLQKELGNEFVAEVRYRSKSRFSEHIAFVDERGSDLAAIRAMIDHVT